MGYAAPVATIRDLVEQRVSAALEAALASGSLPASADGAPLPTIAIVRPQATEHGDFSTNLA